MFIAMGLINHNNGKTRAQVLLRLCLARKYIGIVQRAIIIVCSNSNVNGD
jgi:hypothetical protein